MEIDSNTNIILLSVEIEIAFVRMRTYVQLQQPTNCFVCLNRRGLLAGWFHPSTTGMPVLFQRIFVGDSARTCGV